MEDDGVAPSEHNGSHFVLLLLLNNEVIACTSKHSWKNSSSFIVFCICFKASKGSGI